MRHSSLLAAFVIALLIPAAAQSAPPSLHEKLVFVESSDVPNKLAKERVAASLAQLAREWHLSAEQIPTIVVFHVSEEAGHALGMNDLAVHRNFGRVGLPEYYEVWLMGRVTLPKYTLALQAVLETHLKIRVSDTEREQVVGRVIKLMRYTVSLHGE